MGWDGMGCIGGVGVNNGEEGRQLGRGTWDVGRGMASYG